MSWKDKAVALVKRYGAPAKFAAKMVLGAVLPGGSVVVDLVGQLLDCVHETAKDQFELDEAKTPAATAADLKRVEDIFDVLTGDLAVLAAQVAALEKLPQVAARLVDTTLATDDRCRAALCKLDSLGRGFDRLAEQNAQLLRGQGYNAGMLQEMLPLIRRTAGGVADFVEELRAVALSVADLRTQMGVFRDGERALAQGRISEAGALLQEAWHNQPQSGTAAAALAAAQAAGHDFAAAEKTLARAVRLLPRDEELVELKWRVTRASRGATPVEASRAAPAAPKVGDVLDGWHLEHLLGRGGWGQVFKARRGEIVRALKVMKAELSRDPEFVERFKGEILALAALRGHMHLVEIHSFGYAADAACWYFLMEFIEGQSLEHYLKQKGPLTLAQAVWLFARVADGLALAHARGVVHRDVKPENILLRKPKGLPALVDFGLAAAAGSELTRPGGSAGFTPMFAAPEQLRGKRADARTDVYALAASMYYALNYDKREHREPDQFEAEQAPEALREILTRALQPKPEKRPANAAEFRDLLAKTTIQAAPTPGVTKQEAGRRQREEEERQRQETARRQREEVERRREDAVRPVGTPLQTILEERRREEAARREEQELALARAVQALEPEEREGRQREEQEAQRARMAEVARQRENVARLQKEQEERRRAEKEDRKAEEAARRDHDEEERRRREKEQQTRQPAQTPQEAETELAQMLESAKDSDDLDDAEAFYFARSHGISEERYETLRTQIWAEADRDDAAEGLLRPQDVPEEAVGPTPEEPREGPEAADEPAQGTTAKGAGLPGSEADKSSPPGPGQGQLSKSVKLRKAAEQGDADAQYRFGVEYSEGRRRPRDDAAAVQWFHKAAAQGHRSALTRLGMFCEEGRGTPQNSWVAARLYRQAAKQGDTQAQYNLARMYEKSHGPLEEDTEHGFGDEAEDEEAAEHWSRRASNCLMAADALHLWDEDGSSPGGPRDAEEAFGWYLRAAEGGFAEAQNAVGRLYEKGRFVNRADATAVRWYLAAAEQGHVPAQYNLARMYEISNGVIGADAAQWYRQAARQGHPGAQNALGWMYENGCGTRKKRAYAVRWYRKAAEQGDEDAKKNLERLTSRDRGR